MPGCEPSFPSVRRPGHTLDQIPSGGRDLVLAVRVDDGEIATRILRKRIIDKSDLVPFGRYAETQNRAAALEDFLADRVFDPLERGRAPNNGQVPAIARPLAHEYAARHRP